MDALKLHVLLNYYPAIGVVIATFSLAAGLWFRSTALSRFALKLFVFVGVLTLAVVLTGEFASWAAEWDSGARRDALDSHKISATIALAFTALTGVSATAALARGVNIPERGRRAAFVTLVLAIAASVILFMTILKGRNVKWAEMSAAGTAFSDLNS